MSSDKDRLWEDFLRYYRTDFIRGSPLEFAKDLHGSPPPRDPDAYIAALKEDLAHAKESLRAEQAKAADLERRLAAALRRPPATPGALTRAEVLGLLKYVHPDHAPDDDVALALAKRLTALLPGATR